MKKAKEIEKKVTYEPGNPPEDSEGYEFTGSLGVLNFKEGTIAEVRRYKRIHDKTELPG